MSDYESISASIVESFSGMEDAFPDDDSQMDSYVNDRRERYDEPRGNYERKSKGDSTSTNKKCVQRVNPTTKSLVNVEFFPTKITPNFPIKNALTGVVQSFENRIFRVGTKDEDLFFSVILATGELKKQDGSPTLFYEHPDHYERHFFTKLPQQLKTDWEIKRNHALSKIRLQKAPVETGTSGVILVK